MRDKRMDSRATAAHEMTLIRIGHHLWREYKSMNRSGWPIPALCAALKSVWDAKEAVRVVLRQEHLESFKKRSELATGNLRRYRAGRS